MNNAKIQLTSNNTKNNNHKEQNQNTNLQGIIQEILITNNWLGHNTNYMEQRKKDQLQEHYKKYRSQGTIQKHQLQGTIPETLITSNNKKNTCNREQFKNSTNMQ